MFHVFVGRIYRFFFSINVCKHALKYQLEDTGNVSRNVSVICSSSEKFQNFLTFSPASVTLKLFCRWLMATPYHHVERWFDVETLYCLFLFASLFRYLSTLFFFRSFWFRFFFSSFRDFLLFNWHIFFRFTHTIG